MKQFKIRASAASKIVTSPNATEISVGAKTFCETWAKEQLYNRRKVFSSKYTDKGNVMEDNSIDTVAEHFNYGLLIKNEHELFNDFMTGTPDLILPELIIDVKNSWDPFTFPLFDKKVKSDYYWQGQVYMRLCNTKRFKLVYVLSDTPVHLIRKEAYWYAKDNGYEDLTEDLYREFEKRMTYSDVSMDLKIKSYDIELNMSDIELIEKQVIKCRNYIQTLCVKTPKK